MENPVRAFHNVTVRNCILLMAQITLTRLVLESQLKVNLKIRWLQLQQVIWLRNTMQVFSCFHSNQINLKLDFYGGRSYQQTFTHYPQWCLHTWWKSYEIIEKQTLRNISYHDVYEEFKRKMYLTILPASLNISYTHLEPHYLLFKIDYRRSNLEARIVKCRHYNTANSCSCDC